MHEGAGSGVPVADGDPAYRHGGPGAGWYRTTSQGWRPVTDTEAAHERYEDMRHYMHDPREGDGGSPHEPPVTGR